MKGIYVVRLVDERGEEHLVVVPEHLVSLMRLGPEDERAYFAPPHTPWVERPDLEG